MQGMELSGKVEWSSRFFWKESSDIMRALSRSMLIDRGSHICTGGTDRQPENKLGAFLRVGKIANMIQNISRRDREH